MIPFKILLQSYISIMKMKLPLFYWSNVYLQGKEKENYGDLLSKYIVEKISKRTIKWVHPSKFKWFESKKHYLAIGSILGQATKNSLVWGSGIIEENQRVAKAKFFLVRGPRTQKRLSQLGIKCPKIYGDPALLLPDFFSPQVVKKYEVGFIPHYIDKDKLSNLRNSEKHLIIDVNTNDIEETTRSILSCEKILSSSLHGIIVAHAYGIPAIWIKLSDDLFGDDIKFIDYMETVGINPYQGLKINDFEKEHDGCMNFSSIFDTLLPEQILPSSQIIRTVKEAILKVCPFKNE